MSVLAATPVSEGWAWKRLETTGGPSARRNHAMSYDPVRKVTVLFGGLQRGGKTSPPLSCLGDTWTFDGTRWTHVTVSGPPARENARVVFDEARERTLLYGGSCGEQWYNDLWEFDGLTWTQVPTERSPDAGHTDFFVYERSTKSTVLLRSNFEQAFKPVCELWRLTGNNWKLVSRACEEFAHRGPRVGAVWFDDRTGKLSVLGSTANAQNESVSVVATLSGETWSMNELDASAANFLQRSAWDDGARVLLTASQRRSRGTPPPIAFSSSAATWWATRS